MNHGAIDRGHTTAGGYVHQDRGKGYGCAVHQTPGCKTPSVSSLDTYTDRPQELVPVDITDDMVTEVSGKLTKGAGP